jgi:hypothetical protein
VIPGIMQPGQRSIITHPDVKGLTTPGFEESLGSQGLVRLSRGSCGLDNPLTIIIIIIRPLTRSR